MVARILLIASAACVLNLANGSTEPFPGFHPCKTNDEECLLDITIKGIAPFADGIPTLDVKRMDPLFFKTVDASSPNLKLILNNMIVTGLKTCKPLKVKRDGAKSQMVVITQCDLKLDGDYEMDGKILILTVKGNGKLHVSLKSIINKVTLNYIIKEGKDGKQYIRVKNYNYTYELTEKSDVSLEGLFQDNDVLRQTAEGVIKNNGNEIVHEIGSEVFKFSVKEIIENISRFLAKLPYDEISLD